MLSAPEPVLDHTRISQYTVGSTALDPVSQRGGWHYRQRPSGENVAGAKRGRPAPGEHRGKGIPDGGRARGGRVI
ncbi:hypothetical protein DY000_02052270 [Brassica cretica]|uniref:Uncharacterized protein n=1 Tax=Brassica cretica TaxID=69181 RepID=A0ABQ7AKX3_BRACR|nr:hypothetical protein DY000_02052270 [Brassica cretica]